MAYEIIESKSWKNIVTNQTASIYGSVPYVNDEDKKNWKVVINGYTFRNLKTNTVGIGRKPFKNLIEARNHLKLLNSL